jgi:hypothetical protein
VTNHSGQGQTADSVPGHRETELVTVGRHTLSQCPPRLSSIVNAAFWRFRSSVENFQVAVMLGMVRETTGKQRHRLFTYFATGLACAACGNGERGHETVSPNT